MDCSCIDAAEQKIDQAAYILAAVQIHIVIVVGYVNVVVICIILC